MKFDSFNNCIRIFDGWSTMDESIISELLKPDQNIEGDLIIPFSRELNLNLLEKDLITGKSDLLKFYIREHSRINEMVLANTILLFDNWYHGSGLDWNDYSKDGNTSASRDECFILSVFSLYENIFFEVSRCCEEYNFDYLDLCKELKIDTVIYFAIMQIRHKRGKSPLESYFHENLYTHTPNIESFNHSFLNVISGTSPGKNISNFMQVYFEHKSSKEKSNNSKFESKDSKELSIESELLKKELKALGFFELEKIKTLSKEGLNTLFDEIFCNDFPYKIAMFDYLGFFKHLEKKYCNTKKERDELLHNILYRSTRNIKANINTLSKGSSEDRNRYTAHKYQSIVVEFYQTLK